MNSMPTYLWTTCSARQAGSGGKSSSSAGTGYPQYSCAPAFACGNETHQHHRVQTCVLRRTDGARSWQQLWLLPSWSAAWNRTNLPLRGNQRAVRRHATHPHRVIHGHSIQAHMRSCAEHLLDLRVNPLEDAQIDVCDHTFVDNGTHIRFPSNKNMIIRQRTRSIASCAGFEFVDHVCADDVLFKAEVPYLAYDVRLWQGVTGRSDKSWTTWKPAWKPVEAE